MTPDVKKLRELAEKATPGPWFHGAKNGDHKYCVYDKVCWTDDEGRHGDTPNMVVHVSPDDGEYNDAAYIAAANPATMTALLDERDALIHDIGEYVRISCDQARVIERKDAEIERLREALTELVACKALQERIAVEQATMIPETDDDLEALDRLMSDYAARRPKAWEAARASLAQSTPGGVSA